MANSDQSSPVQVEIHYLRADIARLEETVKDLERTLRDGYVTKHQFDPINRMIWSLVIAVLLAFVSAVGSVVFLVNSISLAWLTSLTWLISLLGSALSMTITLFGWLL